MLDIQHRVTHIPGQVNRQQPVCFEDALGYTYPLHLEAVNSKEVCIVNVVLFLFSIVNTLPFKTFMWFLKGRLGSDYLTEYLDNEMIELRDAYTSRVVKLQDDWNECFVPGQSIIMSLVRSEPL